MSYPIFFFLSLLVIFNSCSSSLTISKWKNDEQYRTISNHTLISGELSYTAIQYLVEKEEWEDFQSEPNLVIQDLQLEYQKTKLQKLALIIAELSYHLSQKEKDYNLLSLQYNGTAFYYSYAYLFFSHQTGSPQFLPDYRRACDYYNRSLSNIVNSLRIRKLSTDIDFLEIPMIQGNIYVEWKKPTLNYFPKNFENVHSTYDYRIGGLSTYQSEYGLGVPIVLTSKNKDTLEVTELKNIYEDAVPATLFIEITPDKKETQSPESIPDFHAKANVFDSLKINTITVENHSVPLETDFSTPFALLMHDREKVSGIAATLNAQVLDQDQGLYMLEAYQKDKIPVVFVHGLFSSPYTWIDMINYLYGIPEVREKYQFWIYWYPTGNPIYYSSYRFKETLLAIQKKYNPTKTNSNFKEMVIVSHSMGGLVSKLTALSINEMEWLQSIIVNVKDLEKLKKEDRELLKNMLHFEPLEFTKKFIFIAVPHGGSKLAEKWWAKIFNSFIRFPEKAWGGFQRILNDLTYKLSLSEIQTRSIPTGVESLRPDSTFISVTRNKKFPNDASFHSIHGVSENLPLLSRKKVLYMFDRTEWESSLGWSDSVVDYKSSFLEGAKSNLVLKGNHSIHRNPLAIQEVIRILKEHGNHR
ncbi:lipase family alpha/beta hydrolase [Leptospira ilyithenensis]|uniref:Alpha/beta hydrolase n=1 Tax=Leptospira ilyithenensis TaxID=2484901 RepID=A0A4R9LRL9_9LEPT|nr:hypothetical protein [Leptospira ilyithenensis]TGN13709.1 hypothetical protein EHS11_03545 [Leptospira ilyithenensis]